ncbi:MAG: hypothetical protein ACXVBE_01405, partial [Bdellovibrionota bacterium]
FRKNWLESQSMMEAGAAMAEKSKRVAILLVGLFFSSIFLIAGIVVAVLELGTQIDRGNGIHYSGIMISATILLALGGTIVALSVFCGPKVPEKVERPQGQDRIKDLAEECISVFLSHLNNKGGSASSEKKTRL